MSHTNQAPYIFVIETDSYAGNFEREMVAYITGATGECGVGDEEAEVFFEEVEEEVAGTIQGKTSQQPDDSGCFRPATIWGDPHYNSVAALFDVKPTKAEIALMKERAERYCDYKVVNAPSYDKKVKRLKIKGFSLVTQKITRTVRSLSV